MNETELLFTEVLNCDRSSLYLNKEKRLDRNISSEVARILKRRICGEPIQYILGKGEFMGLQFKVNQDVLIMRPDTEILVETVISVFSCQLSAVPAAGGSAFGGSCQLEGCKILEIGTGSGCIAVSLAKFLPDTKITATDISQAALDVARKRKN